MIIHRKLSKMKNKILPTCLQGNYEDSLGEFGNTSYGVVGTERVNTYFECERQKLLLSSALEFSSLLWEPVDIKEAEV